MLDENGKAVLEEQEVKVPRFKVVYVYDVSQTEGKPLPELASDLHGNVAQYDIFMEALRRSSPVPMELKPLDKSTDGFFSLTDQRITIRDDMSQVQTIAAVVHEITHALLHNYEQGTETARDPHTEEVEAESVSSSVYQYYGIWSFLLMCSRRRFKFASAGSAAMW